MDLSAKGLEFEEKGTESKSTVSGVDTQSKLESVCELTESNLLLKGKEEDKVPETRKKRLEVNLL